MKMRLTVAASAVLVAVGVGVLVAPTATASDFGEFTRCDEWFRAPWDPRGWVDDDSRIVISPFGAANVYCASWHGWSAAYQLDPWGNKHTLHASYGFGSSGGTTYDAKFFVWDPAVF
ncbi:hypothetical protein [Rhodococcus triatomae]|nr:hypothetical protein G419_11257 [Rhodococcus triatomae BKS 15-14]